MADREHPLTYVSPVFLFGAYLSYTVSSAPAVNHLGKPLPVAAARKVELYCSEPRVASHRRFSSE